MKKSFSKKETENGTEYTMNVVFDNDLGDRQEDVMEEPDY